MSNAEHIKQTLSTNKPYRHQQHHLPKISQNVSRAVLLSMLSLVAVYKRGKAEYEGGVFEPLGVNCPDASSRRRSIR